MSRHATPVADMWLIWEECLVPGWQRMALQILYFVPYDLLQPAASFSAISQKLLVSPVLKKLVFLNSPDEVISDSAEPCKPACLHAARLCGPWSLPCHCLSTTGKVTHTGRQVLAEWCSRGGGLRTLLATGTSSASFQRTLQLQCRQHPRISGTDVKCPPFVIQGCL